MKHTRPLPRLLLASLLISLLGLLAPAAQAQIFPPGGGGGGGGGGGSCDPSRASCLPPGGGGGGGGGLCTLFPNRPECQPGGGGGGGTCTAPPGGNPSCGGAGPAGLGGGGGAGVQLGGGNPINLVNGNKYQEETDLAALPGVLGLELKRYYNSQSRHAGIVGPQWRLSYETVLYDLGSQIQILQADGRRITLAKGPGGTLCTSPQLSDGQVRIERRADGQPVYHWRWPDGRTLSFHGGSGGGHPLHTVRAASGELLQLSYNPLGDLIGVQDPQGRKLSLIYGRAGAGQRALLQAVDTPTGRIAYQHDKQGRLLQASFSAKSTGGLATTPEFTRIYHHEAQHNGGHSFALTGISLQTLDPKTGQARTQRLSTYAYDREGRAVLSSKGLPLQLDGKGQPAPDTGIEQISLQFVQKPLPTEGKPDREGIVQPQNFGKTLLTNSLGQQSTLLSAIVGGQFRLIELRGPGCSSCGPANMRYGYDSNGRLLRSTQLDVQGQPVQAELRRYDRHGRLIETARQTWAAGKPQPAQWLQRYDYEDRKFPDGSIALSQQPSLVSQPSVIAGKTRSTAFEFNEQGQVLRISERGWSPIDAEGQAKPSPLERSTTYRYTVIAGKSVLAEIDGPLPNGPKGTPEDSDVTQLGWDETGLLLQSLRQAGGRRHELSYEPATGRVSSVRNEAGLSTQFSYNPAGQPTLLRTQGPGWPQASLQSIQYDALGRPVEWGQGEAGSAGYGGEQRAAYDLADRLVLRASMAGELDRFRYDAEGRLTGRTRHAAGLEQSEAQEFDAQGRIVRIRASQGRSLDLVYDKAGRPSLWIDSLGRNHGPSPRSATSAAAPARVRHLHDDWGREVQTRSPDAGVNSRWFDAADRLVAGLDALGQRARYAYEPDGRIAEQHIDGKSGSPTLSTRWRYQGRLLVALEHPTQSERYQHDALGRLIAQEVLRPGLPSVTTRYEYDDAGRLIAQSLPDGSWLRQVRDGLGQITALERERLHSPWLRWLLPTQSLVSEIERDGVGLRHLRNGNGLTQHWQRSRDGALARLQLLDTRAQAERISQAEAQRRYGRLMDMLGMASAQAAEAGTSVATAHAAPGAVGMARDPAALRDHRYLWDAQGNLLLDADPSARTLRSYAYDGRDRLIVEAAQLPATSEADGPRHLSSRWLFDASGRRLLQQQDQHDARELQAGTQRPVYEAGSHRWLAAPSTVLEPSAASAVATQVAMYDAQGQPQTIGQRRLEWDALGRLSAIQDGGAAAPTRYRYNHRGERIAKQLAHGQTHYLYQQRRLTAELDGAGKIQRQYLYLADQPLALIDTPAGQDLAAPEPSAASDLQRLWRSWFGAPERMVWLHSNHLGAVELATDAQGRSAWQGQYGAHGALLGQQGKLTLNLRLPGQYFDAESGLHHNNHRYYDPQRGEYLSPDPLGTPDGPNAYSYVRGNPLRYVDPEGLVLFAFDGTGNDETKPAELSNVVKFRDAYLDVGKHYITGPGTKDPESGIEGGLWDTMKSTTGKARIAKMIEYLNREADGADDETAIDIDVTGFSRGAAQARDFANQVARLTNNGWYSYKDKDGKDACQKLSFRFMGIFDTVLSTHTGSYQLGIPDAFQHVAHAVALNEYRGNLIKFPLESIAGGATPAGKTRTERGFLGSHSDIGGSFPDGDLAKVALVWMIDQAKAAGVSMREPDRTIIADPVLHDKSSNLFAPDGPAPTSSSEDRDVRGLPGGTQRQRRATIGGMSYADTVPFINYDSNPTGNVSGKVDMKAYAQWLDAHGYGLNLSVGGGT